MKEAYRLSIPETPEEVCNPQRVALLVYDMQVGILRQIANPHDVTRQVRTALAAARDAGVGVLLASSFAAKRTHGHVSVPHGDDLATDGFA